MKSNSGLKIHTEKSERNELHKIGHKTFEGMLIGKQAMIQQPRGSNRGHKSSYRGSILSGKRQGDEASGSQITIDMAQNV